MYACTNSPTLLLYKTILCNYILPYSILQARLYDVVYEVYQIIIPIHVAKRQFRELEKVHTKLVDCFQNIVAKVTIYHFLFDHLYTVDCRGIREVLELTTGLVSMVLFLVKALMDRSLSIVSKVSPDCLNSLWSWRNLILTNTAVIIL